jgi:hypothetical protein
MNREQSGRKNRLRVYAAHHCLGDSSFGSSMDSRILAGVGVLVRVYGIGGVHYLVSVET